jgi:endo-1,4-beta-xylanase
MMRPAILLTTILSVLMLSISCGNRSDRPTLRDAFQGRFLVGAAVNDDVVSGRDVKAAAIVKEQYNTVTAENAMKWVWIHPEWNRYNFGPADRFVEFGEKNGMFIIGHTLVWHSQIPSTAFEDENGKLLGRDAMLARMRDHITTVVGRYKGKVKGWDVVNEALTDEGELRKNNWVETVGEDYVARAFEFAHQADPDAELYYNDYSLDKPAKRDAAVRLVRDLKSQGLRVDGVGIQGHWGWDYPTTENLEDFITSMGGIGVKVLVTELDLDVLPPALQYEGADVSLTAEMREGLNPYAAGLPDSVEKKQVHRYLELFGILLKYADLIDRVTFWGVCDKTSWLNDWPVGGRTSYPLLFDRDYRPKPVFRAIIEAAKKSK